MALLSRRVPPRNAVATNWMVILFFHSSPNPHPLARNLYASRGASGEEDTITTFFYHSFGKRSDFFDFLGCEQRCYCFAVYGDDRVTE